MDFPLLHLTTRGYLFQDLTHICNLQFIGGGQQKKENRSQDWSSIFYLRLWRENDESNSSLDFPELKPSVCSFFCEKNKKTPFHPLIDHHVPYPKKKRPLKKTSRQCGTHPLVQVWDFKNHSEESYLIRPCSLAVAGHFGFMIPGV